MAGGGKGSSGRTELRVSPNTVDEKTPVPSPEQEGGKEAQEPDVAPGRRRFPVPGSSDGPSRSRLTPAAHWAPESTSGAFDDLAALVVEKAALKRRMESNRQMREMDKLGKGRLDR